MCLKHLFVHLGLQEEINGSPLLSDTSLNKNGDHCSDECKDGHRGRHNRRKFGCLVPRHRPLQGRCPNSHVIPFSLLVLLHTVASMGECTSGYRTQIIGETSPPSGMRLPP